MSRASLSGFLDTLRTRLGARAAGSPDAELLERFVARRDETAFEGLVWRHGSMVLGICRRVLWHEQDVEDAFQATFLVLARKAASVGRREALAAWLYQTAYRVALRARAGAVRRSLLQVLPDTIPATEIDDLSCRELRPVLDEEILRLPVKYRAPVILCYFEGLTTEEAARRLRCPRGTVNSRLAWARQRLRARLVRRGVGLSVGLAACALASEATAAVPAVLAAATVRAAVSMATGNRLTAAAASPAIELMEGVLHAMWSAKVRLLVLVLVTAGALTGGASLLAHRVLGAGPVEEQGQPTAEPPKPPPAKPDDEDARRRKQHEDYLKEMRVAYELMRKQAAQDIQLLHEQRNDLEKKELKDRIQSRLTRTEAEEALRLEERRGALQREDEEAEIKAWRQKKRRHDLGDARLNEEQLHEVEVRLRDAEERHLVNEEKRSKTTRGLRERLIAAEEEYDLAAQHQRRERDAIEARLRAAEERLAQATANAHLLPAERPGSDVERKLDQVLRELAELRRELRDKGR